MQEFDKVHGPAWHCIVGSSFGSFVTHSTGCFLYFSMEKLYILLFRTKIQKATEWVHRMNLCKDQYTEVILFLLLLFFPAPTPISIILFIQKFVHDAQISPLFIVIQNKSWENEGMLLDEDLFNFSTTIVQRTVFCSSPSLFFFFGKYGKMQFH